MNHRTSGQWAFGLLFVLIGAVVALCPQVKKQCRSESQADSEQVLQTLNPIRTSPLDSIVAVLNAVGKRVRSTELETATEFISTTEVEPEAKAYEVETIKDIAYYEGDDADKNKHKLDLYLPKGKKDFPVLFFVHGGAWVSGDRNFFGVYSAIGTRFAKSGIGAVVISYRLSPKVRHPEHIKDVARAFAWTHKNIGKHGGRNDQLFVCGHSAGGHLVALLATDETYLKAEGLTLKAIKGAIPMSGVYLIAENFLPAVFGKGAEASKSASPIRHVHAGCPPFLVIYADKDMPFCDVSSAAFCKDLKGCKCNAELCEIKDRNHMSIIMNFSKENDPALDAALKFIDKCCGK
jgi:acetyl esterase/lipase